MSERSERAAEALLDYSQADEDGVMVLASRQAIHETVDNLRKAEARADEAERLLRGLRDAARLVNDAWDQDEAWVRYETADRAASAFLDRDQ